MRSSVCRYVRLSASSDVGRRGAADKLVLKVSFNHTSGKRFPLRMISFALFIFAVHERESVLKAKIEPCGIIADSGRCGFCVCAGMFMK